jgi:hypothetical protein
MRLFSYWLGSQFAPSMYQYRLVLAQDDKMINVATDADFNIEGEIKYPVNPNVVAKSKFVVLAKSYIKLLDIILLNSCL